MSDTTRPIGGTAPVGVARLRVIDDALPVGTMRLVNPSPVPSIAEVHLLNPGLADVITKVNPAGTGSTRDAINVPISPVPNPSDTVLFEQPADASKKLYLPRYRLIDQPSPQVVLAQNDADWTLTVRLQGGPA